MTEHERGALNPGAGFEFAANAIKDRIRRNRQEALIRACEGRLVVAGQTGVELINDSGKSVDLNESVVLLDGEPTPSSAYRVPASCRASVKFDGREYDCYFRQRQIPGNRATLQTELCAESVDLGGGAPLSFVVAAWRSGQALTLDIPPEHMRAYVETVEAITTAIERAGLAPDATSGDSSS